MCTRVRHHSATEACWFGALTLGKDDTFCKDAQSSERLLKGWTLISLPGAICGPLLFFREVQRRVSPGAYLLPSEMFLLGLGYSVEVTPGGTPPTPRKGRPGKKWRRVQTAIKRGLGGVSASPRCFWRGCSVPHCAGPEDTAVESSKRFFSSSSCRSPEKGREQRLLCWIMLQSFLSGLTDLLWTEWESVESTALHTASQLLERAQMSKFSFDKSFSKPSPFPSSSSCLY